MGIWSLNYEKNWSLNSVLTRIKLIGVWRNRVQVAYSQFVSSLNQYCKGKEFESRWNFIYFQAPLSQFTGELLHTNITFLITFPIRTTKAKSLPYAIQILKSIYKPISDVTSRYANKLPSSLKLSVPHFGAWSSSPFVHGKCLFFVR